MTRAEFIARLKNGLVGLPTTTANDIVADYETHFEDGLAAGRTEAEVAVDRPELRRALRIVHQVSVTQYLAFLSARQVLPSTMPVIFIFWSLWNARTARFVALPKIPSAEEER